MFEVGDIVRYTHRHESVTPQSDAQDGIAIGDIGVVTLYPPHGQPEVRMFKTGGIICFDQTELTKVEGGDV